MNRIIDRMPAFSLLLEVADKELSLKAVWLIFLGLGIVGFAAARYRLWLGLLALIPVAVFAPAHLLEIHDPHVGPAIRSELGHSYMYQSYVAILLGLVLPILGAALRRSAV